MITVYYRTHTNRYVFIQFSEMLYAVNSYLPDELDDKFFTMGMPKFIAKKKKWAVNTD